MFALEKKTSWNVLKRQDFLIKVKIEVILEIRSF